MVLMVFPLIDVPGILNAKRWFVQYATPKNTAHEFLVLASIMTILH